jgi:hypothetical protein
MRKNYLMKGRVLTFILIPTVFLGWVLAWLYLGVVAEFFSRNNLKSLASLCLSTEHSNGDCYCLDEPSILFQGLIFYILLSPLSVDWTAKRLGVSG